MQITRFATAVAAVLCASAISMSAQAQLKNNPMHANLPATAQTKECMMCHQSYEAVAQRTAKMNPNPHSSHRGEPACTTCHRLNEKPRFECNDCHEFNIKMKGE